MVFTNGSTTRTPARRVDDLLDALQPLQGKTSSPVSILPSKRPHESSAFRSWDGMFLQKGIFAETSAERCSPIWPLLFVAGLLGCLPKIAECAGLALMEQSVKELGQSFSGATTNTEDGSSVYYNPAAMAQIHGGLLSLAGYAIIPSANFKDSGSRLSPAVGGSPLTGSDGGDAAITSLIPNFYYLQELTDRLVFGLGVNAPFGSHNAYQPDWKGRYQTLGSELKTLNINPGLALRISDEVSVGAGLSVQYLRASLTNAIDFGTVCLAAFGPAPCAGSGLLPQQADGRVSLSGDSVALGYNFGIYYSPDPDTRIGASYRSRIEHHVEGTADFDVPAAALPLTANTFFTDTRAATATTMPDSVAFGFTRKLDSQWTVNGDALWTHWGLNQELRTRFASAQPDFVERLDWQDTWRYALGVSFRSDASWTFRTGLAYDQSPIPNRTQRSPRIPDNDRIWLSIGLSYRLFDQFTVHGAYAHLFFTDAPINHTGSTGDQLVGRFQQQADILGLQLDWQF